MNIKLILAYDGTSYLGWQKTKEGSSIEEELENALGQILQEKVILQAASRTDRGVHATFQVVNFKTQKEIHLAKLQKGLNALLPRDIAILQIEQVPDDFHPTLDAMGKEYHYHMSFEPVLFPQERHFVWHYPYEMDLAEMQAAKDALIGTLDFTSLTNIRTDDTIRTVSRIAIEELRPARLLFKVTGSNFLYKMVRNIVGTLVYVGKGEIAAADIPGILLAKDRRLSGITAPAHGLFLAKVFYSRREEEGCSLFSTRGERSFSAS